MSEIVYLSLGSNIGDREANLAGAITALSTYYEIKNIRSASFYETEPLYNKNQPFFLNTVIELETDLSAFQLLDAVRHIEQLLGRTADHETNMPRTIDIDILCYGNSFIETKELTIPHPDIPNRRFVLVPFNEIAPEIIVQKWNISVKSLLKICPDNSIVKKHIPEKSA